MPYIVVSVDKATGYCCAYGPYVDYFDANQYRIRLENPSRRVYVIALESAR